MAQPDGPQWLQDRRYNEGIGVRTGDLELHPGIAGEAGYDSNWYLRSDKQGVANGPSTAPVIPAIEFRITPSLYLSTLDPQRREGELVATPPTVAFRAGVNATHREFIGVSSDSNASSSTNDVSAQRNVSIGADARLDVLPQHPWGGAVFASYMRTIQPNSVDADPDLSFNQDTIGAGAEIVTQPGGGTLDWHFGYRFSDTLFEESVGTPYDNITNEAYTQGRWKFRPRTALLYDASLRFISYPNEANSGDVPLVSSTPVRARIGLSGLITERFSVLGMIGWGASFYDTTVPNLPQFDSVIAQAELRWFLSASPGIANATDLGLALSSIALGYTRDFQNRYLGGYYTQDRGYLKFLLSLRGAGGGDARGRRGGRRISDSGLDQRGSGRLGPPRGIHGCSRGRDALYRVPLHEYVRSQRDAALFGEYQQYGNPDFSDDPCHRGGFVRHVVESLRSLSGRALVHVERPRGPPRLDSPRASCNESCNE